MENSVLKKNIEHLESLLNYWADKIPEQIISSTDETSKYKCRKQWFQNIGLGIDRIARKGFIENSLKMKSKIFYESMREYFQKEEQVNGLGRTKPEHIKEGNLILRETINYLKNNYSVL